MKKEKWYMVIMEYDGEPKKGGIELHYTKKIKGVDYFVCEVDGKIIWKSPVKGASY